MDDSTSLGPEDTGAPLSLLVVGDTSVHSVPLPPRGAVVLGRAGDCDVKIADSSVSRRHARLHLSPLRVEDLGSANGTRVGSRKATDGDGEIALSPGEAFTVGRVTVFVQRARPRVGAPEVRNDAYFEARLVAECARATKFGLRFAVLSFAVKQDAGELDRAVRTLARGVDVASAARRGEARVLLAHATPDAAEAFAARVCSLLPKGECDVGIATFPDAGADAGSLLVAVRARVRPRASGAEGEVVEPVAEDAAGRGLRTRASQLARTGSNVLFVGETGTGKRALARWVHAQSKSGHRSLVRVSCDGVSEAQLERVIFGEGDAEGGGAIELADGGTLLLEHVDTLPAPFLGRLAHVAEYDQTYRTGSTTPRRVHVRILATAHRRQLDDALRRLATVVVAVPPLRARPDDIASLAQAFARAACAAAGRSPVALSPEALEALRRHSWPGNIRTLRAVVERAVASTEGPRIDVAALDLSGDGEGTTALHDDVEVLERERIAAALAEHDGNRSRTARALGIARNTLLTRIKSYGLDG